VSKKLPIFVLLGLLVAGTARSQSARLDSLRSRIQQTTGTAQVDALNDFGAAVFSYDYLQSKKYIQQAFDLANRLQYKKGMAQAKVIEGIIDSSTGSDTAAMMAFRKSRALSREAGDRSMEGNAEVYIGQTYLEMEMIDSADFFFQRGYAILKDSANPLYLSYLYLNRARFYEVKNDPARQWTYLLKSWNIRKKLKQKRPFVWIGVKLAAYQRELGDFEKSVAYLDEVQAALGKDTVDSEEINAIYKERAIVAAKIGNYRRSFELFGKAIAFYERNTYPIELTDLFIVMGNALVAVSNYDMSLKYFFRALNIAHSQHFSRQTARLNFEIAWIYYELNQNAVAEKYCESALQLTSKYGFEREESSVLNLLGMLAARKSNNSQAMDYFNRALAIRSKNKYLEMEASTLSNIARIFLRMNDYQKAEQTELKSLRLETQSSHRYGICESYKDLGQIYLQQNDFVKAAHYLNEAEAMGKELHAFSFLTQIYESQRDLHRRQSNYQEAYRYSLLFEHLKDSLFNQRLGNQVASMQYDFELEQKDKEIKILGQQQELAKNRLALQQAEIGQQRLIITSGVVLFFLITVGAFIAFRFYRKVRKLNMEISEQNEEIATQAEELREANTYLSKLNREMSEQKEEIQAQAEELKESNDIISLANETLEERIKARTIELKEAYTELDTFFYRSSHDFRRPLTTFMGLAEVAKITVKDQTALELFEKVNDTARSLDKMLLKLQSISAAGVQELIYSEVLMEHLFQIEQDNFREEILRKSIRIMTEVHLTQPFVSYPALVKFIVQNLLENAIAFSMLENPIVRMKAFHSGHEVVIEVADNGQGIEPVHQPRVFEMYFRANERSKGNGLGLYIVKKMVDKLGGRIELKSEKGLGTIIRVFLPNRAES